MNKAPRELREEDIVELIRVGRSEGPMLEYKGALYEARDRGNKELLLDICSMANSAGGYLLIGISERRENGQSTGVPDLEAPLGIEIENPEHILASYEARILECIDERLSVESHAIRIGNERFVLAFRIPNSFSKPHMVKYQGHTAFPARRERQRYDLTATEVKDLVMRTASRIEVAEAELQVALSQGMGQPESPTLTIVTIPVFTRNFAVDFRSSRISEEFARLDLTGQGHGERREPAHSVEGLTRTGPGPGARLTLAHNGLLRLVVPIPGQSFMGNRSFNPIVIDLYARGIASGCGNVYAAAELSAPALLGVGISVPNSTIAWYGDEWSSPASVGPFNKIYPSLILNSLIDRIDSQIRPLCDLVHQSLGETSSPAFNGQGDWINRFH
jgi:hypothetical protein